MSDPESSRKKNLLGAIEAGGTKVVCAVAENPGPVFAARTVIPTTSSAATFSKVIDFLSSYPLRAVGIACFGPLDLQRGWITSTPKIGWRDVDVVGPLKRALGVPIGIDTDVNGAALGEKCHGAGAGKDPLLYVTVGTGIGVGVLVGGRPVHGLMHPEGGHMSIRRHPDDSFGGMCAYHGDCLEGLASGPAIEGRWGIPGQDLPPDHPAWELEAYYLAEALCNMVYLITPQRIVLGGGVMNQQALLPLIRRQLGTSLAGYIVPLDSSEAIEDLVVPAGLGHDAGIVGALEMARQAAGEG
jgi:fructokinase